ncbi:MAG: type IV pilus modification protein PilV [Halieaceae bacterium]|jgi:type IV pilus assembly protein PilV|nr:type IV pilus modification protein PilV [Halieaceae bacterium]
MMKKRSAHRRPDGSGVAKGFTLIEILVALIVLSFGVLGVAGLQLITYQNLQSSLNYGTAAMLANEIADRMIVNSAQVLADSYDHSGAPNSVTNCATETCNASQMATYDIDQWQTAVTGVGLLGDDVKMPGSLPSPSGAVARVGTTDNFTITLRWDDDSSGSTGTNCPPTTASDLDCYQITLGF